MGYKKLQGAPKTYKGRKKSGDFFCVLETIKIL